VRGIEEEGGREGGERGVGRERDQVCLREGGREGGEIEIKIQI